MAVRREFMVYRDVLERIEVFKYLRHWLAMNDDVTHVIRTQLIKA